LSGSALTLTPEDESVVVNLSFASSFEKIFRRDSSVVVTASIKAFWGESLFDQK
jgi:hypothetical protein